MLWEGVEKGCSWMKEEVAPKSEEPTVGLWEDVGSCTERGVVAGAGRDAVTLGSCCWEKDNVASLGDWRKLKAFWCCSIIGDVSCNIERLGLTAIGEGEDNPVPAFGTRGEIGKIISMLCGVYDKQDLKDGKDL